MKADLRQVFNTSGMKKEFDYLIPHSALESVKGFSFSGDVKVKGSFYNRADVVHIDYLAEFTLNIVCDRCLKELDREYSYEFEHVVVTSVNHDNDDYVIAENYSLDIDDIALSDLLLELPTKLLCRDDCKGLCPVCGCDLNESGCDHQK